MSGERRKKTIGELTRVSCEGYRDIEKLPVIVLADNVRSMHNIGSMFRTADAFLMRGLLLCGISGIPPHPDISKTALGAERSVMWRHEESALDAICELKKEGWKICVAEQTVGSISLEKFLPDKNERYVLVMGNEVEGVDARIVEMADICLEIPQCGVKHSLNVSVCAGIMMWHFYSAMRL